ncbi:hypothetical protein [Gordonia aichiensis]
MTFDLSKSTDPEIALAAAVLLELDSAAARVGIEYLVVGATARNMVARSITGATPERATRDVDIAVAVADCRALTIRQSPPSWWGDGVPFEE